MSSIPPQLRASGHCGHDIFEQQQRHEGTQTPMAARLAYTYAYTAAIALKYQRSFPVTSLQPPIDPISSTFTFVVGDSSCVNNTVSKRKTQRPKTHCTPEAEQTLLSPYTVKSAVQDDIRSELFFVYDQTKNIIHSTLSKAIHNV